MACTVFSLIFFLEGGKGNVGFPNFNLKVFDDTPLLQDYWYKAGLCLFFLKSKILWRLVVQPMLKYLTNRLFKMKSFKNIIACEIIVIFYVLVTNIL